MTQKKITNERKRVGGNTISGPELGFNALSFADQDWEFRVQSLEVLVILLNESSVNRRHIFVFISIKLRGEKKTKELSEEDERVPSSRTRGRRLAEKNAKLLKILGNLTSPCHFLDSPMSSVVALSLRRLLLMVQSVGPNLYCVAGPLFLFT